jgi:hypothetical protein
MCRQLSHLVQRNDPRDQSIVATQHELDRRDLRAQQMQENAADVGVRHGRSQRDDRIARHEDTLAGSTHSGDRLIPTAERIHLNDAKAPKPLRSTAHCRRTISTRSTWRCSPTARGDEYALFCTLAQQAEKRPEGVRIRGGEHANGVPPERWRHKA